MARRRPSVRLLPHGDVRAEQTEELSRPREVCAMTPSTTRAPRQAAGGAGGTQDAGGTLGDTRRGLWTGRDLGPNFLIVRGSPGGPARRLPEVSLDTRQGSCGASGQQGTACWRPLQLFPRFQTFENETKDQREIKSFRGILGLRLILSTFC